MSALSERSFIVVVVLSALCDSCALYVHILRVALLVLGLIRPVSNHIPGFKELRCVVLSQPFVWFLLRFEIWPKTTTECSTIPANVWSEHRCRGKGKKDYSDMENTVRSRYIAVIFLYIIHGKRPIASLWGVVRECTYDRHFILVVVVLCTLSYHI